MSYWLTPTESGAVVLTHAQCRRGWFLGPETLEEANRVAAEHEEDTCED